jgi:glycosyltransferase involved in cell wall biosynthesis
MMELPKISIITPSYNQGHFIEETILSVLNQNYHNLEYIIIDGGSTDNTVNIIKKYEKHISYWVSEKDNGQCNALNKGLAKATGQIIGWINSDDIYFEGTFNKCAQLFKKNPTTDVLFGNYICIDESGRVIHNRKEITYDFNISLWTKECHHANLAGFFRRKCFDTCGYFREDLHMSMDFELYLRFAYNGCKFLHLNSYLGAYRFHSESKSVLAFQKALKENDMVFSEYLNKLKMGTFEIAIKSFYFKYFRYLKKLFTGCYTYNSLRTKYIIDKISKK